ncbi:MAG: nucleotidyltransferase family protein [Deltaproteobacteria bacterium]|nr:nucleotidyltransferase family protein [Deltaproteobacteria bacterium]
MISGIVLAAGAARRLGEQKLLLDLKGKPVLRWVLEAALGSGLDEIICVTRGANKTRTEIHLEDIRLRWINNDHADEGQSTSVIAGLKAVSSNCEAALFLVGDQPLVQIDLINGLIELFRRSKALIAAPAFHGQTRNPVLFHRQLFPELLQVSGDRGGKDVIEKNRQRTALLSWDHEQSFLDLDTWEDYERLKRLA